MSAPVKKTTNKIKQRTTTTVLLKCCLQTWSRYITIFGGSFLSLPEGISFHFMIPYSAEDKKVIKAETLTLTWRCFSTFLPPAWSGKPRVLYNTLPPLHWSGTLWACLEEATGVCIKVLEAWAAESPIQVGLHCISCTRKAQTNPTDGVDVDGGFLFTRPAGQIKRRASTSFNISSETKDLHSSNMTKSKYRTSLGGATERGKRLQDERWEI